MTHTMARVSKSCNRAIARLRKMSENLRKIWTNERKTERKKLALILYFCQNLIQFSFFWHFLYMAQISEDGGDLKSMS